MGKGAYKVFLSSARWCCCHHRLQVEVDLMQPVDINKKPVRRLFSLFPLLLSQSSQPSLTEWHRLCTAPPSTTSVFGSITFPSLCSGSHPRRVQSSSAVCALLTTFTFRVCALLLAEFEKALPVTTSRSCIRRAVLKRPSAARACS
jgi:hypothetical protein